MMKIDFAQPLTRPEPGAGPYMLDAEEPMRLGYFCATALNQPGAKGDDALRRGRLVAPLFAGGEMDLTPEDVTLIRSCLKGMDGAVPHAVAQAHDMLEGKAGDG